MKKAQLNISIEGGSFIRIVKGLINFGYPGLPHQVHFSFSSGRNKATANFHVTREVKDRHNKPQIRIFEISKSDLKRIQPLIAKAVFGHVCELLPIPYQQNLSRKDFYKKVAFSSFDDLPQFPSIWDKEGIKKGKLRLTENSLSALERWVTEPKVQQRFAKHFLTLPWRHARKPETGFLLSPLITGPVLIINGQYFRQREVLAPEMILKTIFGDFKARKLIVKARLAIRDIQTAADRAASSKFSQPILLTIDHAPH